MESQQRAEPQGWWMALLCMALGFMVGICIISRGSELRVETIIVLLALLLVIAVCLAVLTEGGAKGGVGAQPPPPPPPTTYSYCPYCGKQLTFDSQVQRPYCASCKRYF